MIVIIPALFALREFIRRTVQKFAGFHPVYFIFFAWAPAYFKNIALVPLKINQF
jgi:hypothetical protein